MRWRLMWWRKPTTVEETEAAVERAEPPPPGPLVGAPRLAGFRFETPLPDGGDSAPAEVVDVPAAPVDVALIVRRKKGLRTGGEGAGERRFTAGIDPVLVPSLREQALVYRLAAEQRTEASPEEALAFWVAFLDLCPEDAGAWYAAGRLHFRVGAAPEAREAFEHARRHAPEDAAVAGALGITCGELQAWPEAVAHLEDAVALAPDEPEWLEWLCRAQASAGDGRAAEETRLRYEKLCERLIGNQQR